MAFSKVTLNGDTLMDVTQKTVTAATMLSGTTALKNDGTDITGNIATKTSSNLSASGATVTAPAGYYAGDASKSVATGTAGTPTASKGTVSNHAVSVTPSVTNTTGYITGGTKTGTAVTVSASELVSGTKSISTSGTTDVTNYASASVAAGSATTPATSITANPSMSVVVSAGKNLFDMDCLLEADGWVEENGDYYGQIRNVLTAYPVGTGVPIYGEFKANTQYSVSMTVHIEGEQGTNNGLTVVAYYSDNTHANVCGALRNQTSWLRISGTTTSGKTVTSILISYSNGGTNIWHIKEAMIEEGTSASTYEAYALSASVNATVSTSQSVTPTVSAGYVSSGTAGTVSVSGSATEQLSTQSAQTIHPSTTDQTIAPGKYLTGTQTIKAVTTTNLTAANIVSGITVKIGDSTDDDCVASVTGTASSGYSETLMKNYIERSSSFTDIDWPSGMTKIGSHAFAGCAGFSPSSLPSGVKSIGAYAFNGCTNLALASLPSGITSMSSYAFSGCANLALTSLPSGITRIYDYAFNGCTKLALTSLPSGVTAVGDHAFYQCTSLALTSLPSGVTSISSYAFNCCTGITSISCSGTIGTLGNYSFTGGSSYPMVLASVSFPNMTVSSLAYAFGSTTAANACQYLAFADIGSTQGIAANAFANCYALQTLVLRRTGSICTLANVSAFLNTPLRGYNSQTAEVYVPNALISTYQTATNWSTLYNNGTITFKKIEGSDYDLS